VVSVSKIDKAKDEAETLSSERDPPSTAATPEPADQISEDRIRQRAYLIWIEEGQPEGRAEEHWVRARDALERETRSR
jgi:hypothetical protein